MYCCVSVCVPVCLGEGCVCEVVDPCWSIVPLLLFGADEITPRLPRLLARFHGDGGLRSAGVHLVERPHASCVGQLYQITECVCVCVSVVSV